MFSQPNSNVLWQVDFRSSAPSFAFQALGVSFRKPISNSVPIKSRYQFSTQTPCGVYELQIQISPKTKSSQSRRWMSTVTNL